MSQTVVSVPLLSNWACISQLSVVLFFQMCISPCFFRFRFREVLALYLRKMLKKTLFFENPFQRLCSSCYQSANREQRLLTYVRKETPS
jgi:hypothetical protein